jgi:hypothetical protein
MVFWLIVVLVSIAGVVLGSRAVRSSRAKNEAAKGAVQARQKAQKDLVHQALSSRKDLPDEE